MTDGIISGKHGKEATGRLQNYAAKSANRKERGEGANTCTRQLEQNDKSTRENPEGLPSTRRSLETLNQRIGT